MYDDDDVLIDRLVDGELAGDARREALATFEARPELWRRCALAFVEAQTWRSEMRRLVTPAAASATRAPALAPRPHHLSVWQRSAVGGLAAAGLLVAFVAGRMLSGGRVEPRDEMQIAQAVAPAAAPDVAGAEPTGDAVTLVVNDHRGVPQRVSVPLVEGRVLGKQFSEVPNWSSPELARQLDERGLGLAARRRYAPLYFEQHNQRVPLIVPVDDAVVRPVSRPVY